jgi:antitoxin ParD1/3/4
VDEQVASGGYGTSSEYVRELIRRDRDRQKLRALLVEGLESEELFVADEAFFDDVLALAGRAEGD